MPTIRDVIEALGARHGVRSAILLGRDGLPIDFHTTEGMDAEGLAALVPSVVSACATLGESASQGEFNTSLVEFGDGMALVSVLSPDAILALFVRRDANVGPLLYELEQHRSAIAGLL